MKFWALVLILGITLYGCGGGGSNSANPPPSSTGTPPHISSVDNATFTVGTASSFSLTTTGNPAPTLSLSGTLPAGVTFNLDPDGHTGSLIGTPAAGTAGVYKLTFTGTSTVKPDYVLNFTLTVILFGSFQITGNMTEFRSLHTATLLEDGTVLIAGGFDVFSPCNSSDIYSPSTGTFVATQKMLSCHYGHAATRLPNGKVLITGGRTGSGSIAAELYDPTTGLFNATGDMNFSRANHTSTLLPTGLVLITGGQNNQTIPGILSSAELYDPSTGSFRTTGNISTPRAYHTATILPNGKVLLTGGYSSIQVPGGIKNYLNSAELYDPLTGTFTPTGSMTNSRAYHTATMLPNGLVLIAGGITNNDLIIASAELYDPSTGLFTPTGNMLVERASHSATLLTNGYVLIAGGVKNGILNHLNSAEVYSPSDGTFIPTANMGTRRASHTATLLSDGTVLIAGGDDGSVGAGTRSAELFHQ